MSNASFPSTAYPAIPPVPQMLLYLQYLTVFEINEKNEGEKIIYCKHKHSYPDGIRFLIGSLR